MGFWSPLKPTGFLDDEGNSGRTARRWKGQSLRHPRFRRLAPFGTLPHADRPTAHPDRSTRAR